MVDVTASDIAGESQSSQASSHSSIVSGPSSQPVNDEEPMDSSVCRKRKDRPLVEQGRSLSCDDLDSSSKKVFKTPATLGRHSRLPTAVRERPTIKERPSPVRLSALPVRVRDRPSKKCIFFSVFCIKLFSCSLLSQLMLTVCATLISACLF